MSQAWSVRPTAGRGRRSQEIFGLAWRLALVVALAVLGAYGARVGVGPAGF